MIFIYDDGLNQIGLLSNYEYLSFTKNLRGSGSFEIRISENKVGTEFLQIGNIIALDDYNVGIIVERELNQSSEGRGLILRGFSIEAILSYRVMTESFTNDYSEALVKNIVDKHCVNADDSNRDIDILEIVANEDRGTVQNIEGYLETLDVVLDRILSVDNYGYRIFINSGVLKFDIIEPRDLTASVMFSNKLYNVDDAKKNNSSSNYKNVVFMQGQVDLYSYDYESKIGIERKERGLVNSEIDSSDLADDFGQQILNSNNYEIETIEINIRMNGNPYVYGIDYDLGDVVSVGFDNTIQELQIVGINITRDEKGERISLAFGNQARSIKQLIKDSTTVMPNRGMTTGTAFDMLVSAIVPIASSSVPDGWLLCDGSAINRVTYAALFTAIGTTYGVGDGSTTFNVPNIKGSVIVGLDSAQTEFDALGETGGAKTHTLTIDEMPSHNHGIPASNDSTPDGGIVAPASEDTDDLTLSTTTRNTGGGTAHNNLQPYIVLNYVIKY